MIKKKVKSRKKRSYVGSGIKTHFSAQKTKTVYISFSVIFSRTSTYFCVGIYITRVVVIFFFMMLFCNIW